MRIVLLMSPLIDHQCCRCNIVVITPLITVQVGEEPGNKVAVVEHPYNCNPLLGVCIFACRFYRTMLKLGGRWIFTGRLQAALILLASKMFIRTSMQGVTVCWSLWNGKFGYRGKN